MPELAPEKTRIDHAARAQRSMEVANSLINGQATTPFELANYELTKGQISATLALVEQQRIANLIALSKETFAAYEAREALGTFATAKFGEQIGLRPEIAAALGIESEEGEEA